MFRLHPCPIAVHMESLFTLAFSVLIWIFAQRKTENMFDIKIWFTADDIQLQVTRYINQPSKMNESWNQNGYTLQPKIISLNYHYHYHSFLCLVIDHLLIFEERCHLNQLEKLRVIIFDDNKNSSFCNNLMMTTSLILVVLSMNI